MEAFETFATVGGKGEVHVACVPFKPGTEVEVVISPKSQGAEAGDSSDRHSRLLAALDKARNTMPIGSLNRDELYDRDGVR
jgi:hypothetical protein